MKIKQVLINELKKGVSVRDISRAICMGFLIGIGPIMGITTLISAFVSYRFNLNQVIVQSINYLVYPLQIIFLPVYFKVVTFIFPNLSPFPPGQFEVAKIISLFSDSPWLFLKQFMGIGLVAMLIWLVMSLMFYRLFLIVIQKVIHYFNRDSR